MTRLVAPDGNLTKLDVRTEKRLYKYSVKKDGTYHVENPNHARQLRDEGFIEASLMGIVSKSCGFTCSNCGFGAFFSPCGRCGTVKSNG